MFERARTDGQQRSYLERHNLDLPLRVLRDAVTLHYENGDFESLGYSSESFV